MSSLGNQSRFPKAEVIALGAMNQTHSKLSHHSGNDARRDTDLCADQFVKRAVALQRQLVGIEIEPQDTIVTLDGTNTVRVDFRRDIGFEQVRNRRYYPTNHVTPPSRGHSTLEGNYNPCLENLQATNLGVLDCVNHLFALSAAELMAGAS